MFKNIWMKSLLIVCGSSLSGLMTVTVADAANPEPVTVGMSFLDPITVTEDSALQSGLLDVGLANTETIIIAPDDTVTGTGTGRIVGGARAAADLTITATSGVTINILVETVSTGTGYGLGTWLCDYETGADLTCDGAGMNVTSVASGALRVGVTLTGDGTAVAGNQDGSFDVTVTYQ